MIQFTLYSLHRILIIKIYEIRLHVVRIRVRKKKKSVTKN